MYDNKCAYEPKTKCHTTHRDECKYDKQCATKHEQKCTKVPHRVCKQVTIISNNS